MTTLAAGTLVALVLVALIFGSITRSLVRQQARERNLLLNQIMHLSGRTWEAPPALEAEPEPMMLHVLSDEPDPDLY